EALTASRLVGSDVVGGLVGQRRYGGAPVGQGLQPPDGETRAVGEGGGRSLRIRRRAQLVRRAGTARPADALVRVADGAAVGVVDGGQVARYRCGVAVEVVLRRPS